MPSTIIQTFDEAVEEIVDRLGGRNDSDDRVGDWVNQAQLMFAQADIEMPVWETIGASKDLTIGTSVYNLRTDFQLTDIIGIRLIRNATSKWMMKRFPWQEFRMISTQSSASPVRWARHGDQIAFDGNPNVATTILIDYRRRPTPDLLEVSDQWVEYLLRLATHIGWNALQEYDKSVTQMKLLPGWLQLRLQTPLTEAEWETGWDDDMGLVPQYGC